MQTLEFEEKVETEAVLWPTPGMSLLARSVPLTPASALPARSTQSRREPGREKHR